YRIEEPLKKISNALLYCLPQQRNKASLMTRTKLNDELWHKLFIILRQINVYNKPNLRRTVEGMLYRIRVGCPWRDLPSYFGHWSRIYHQYRYWRKTGKWQKLMKIITANYDSEWLFIDGSVVKAHQHSSGAASHLDEAIGKSVAGNSSKLHLVVDACGNPIHVELTGEQVHDAKMAKTLRDSTINNQTKAVIQTGATIVVILESVSSSTVLSQSYPLSRTLKIATMTH